MGIFFWHGLQQGPVLDTFKQIVQEWNTEHVEAQVELKDFTDYGEPVRQALETESEKQPSLILAPEYMSSRMMEALKERKVIPIYDLLGNELMEKICEIVKRTFGDNEGRLVSLPLNPACGVIYTNKELLKDIGCDEDYVPKTIEDLEKICRIMLQKGLVKGGYTSAWPAAYLIEIPAAQQNQALVDPLNGKLGFGQYKLSQQWLKDHLLDIRRQQKEGIYVYSGKDNNSRKPFVNCEVAFFLQGSTHFSWLQKEVKESESPFEIGCGPLPNLTHGQQGKYAFPLGGGAVWVLDNDKTRKMLQSVKSFLQYLAGASVQEKWHKETAYVPVLKNLPEKLEEFYQNHPVHKAVVSQTIEASLGENSFGIHMPNYSDARKEMFNLIEKILDPDLPEEEVSLLLEEFDEKFSIPSQY
ncbi:MAG: sn-glycerol-3-phosphate ABC transporter substrate-binding protein UgpB [Simkaniaceae bacterium]